MHKLVRNAITDSEIEYLRGIFNTHPHVLTNGMDKVMLPLEESEFAALIKDIIERRLGVDQEYAIVGDNFYKHSSSYFPHCDAVEQTAWLNIVIPIERWGSRGEQKFIVFDQLWMGRNITWLGNFDFDGDFASNKKTKIRPCDGEYFQNGTDLPLADDIWQHMEQRHFNKDYFHSMSGVAYPWEPGNIIVFDSQHIHATGRMQSEAKLGVSIRIAHK